MHVLIVEDYDALRLALSVLIDRAGHTHCWASSGEGALELLRTEPVDVAILDVTLNGPMTGLEVAGRMLANEKTKDIPIIILTGTMSAKELHQRARTEVNALRSAVAILTKPFDDNELLTLIKRLAERTTPAAPDGTSAS